jgi:hypothetical protein
VCAGIRAYEEFFYFNKNLPYKIFYIRVHVRTVYTNLVAEQKVPKITQLVLRIFSLQEYAKNNFLIELKSN